VCCIRIEELQCCRGVTGEGEGPAETVSGRAAVGGEEKLNGGGVEDRRKRSKKGKGENKKIKSRSTRRVRAALSSGFRRRGGRRGVVKGERRTGRSCENQSYREVYWRCIGGWCLWVIYVIYVIHVIGV
jgi:hypothetical protein